MSTGEHKIMKNILKPNRDSILSHLTKLYAGANDGIIEVSYTPPTSGAVNKSEFFKVNEIEKAVDFIVKINTQDGVNTYIGAALRDNNTPPFGRSSAEDYYKSNYVWADLDDADAAKNAKEIYKDLPPSFVVVTGRHPDLRAQVWWKLSVPEQDKAKLKNTLAHVCSSLNGDRSVVDPARVMRVGGSIAWPKKDGRKPELTEFIIPSSMTDSVSIDDLTSHYPLAESPVDKPQNASGAVGLFSSPKSKLFHDNKEWSLEDIEGLLEYIHPDNEYLGWVKVGMAIKDYGLSFDVWDKWSKGGTKYQAHEMSQKWNSFKGTGISIGSLVYHAKQGGWKPATIEQKIDMVISKRETPIHDAETGETEDQPEQDTPKERGRFYYDNAPDIGINLDVNDFVQGLLTENTMSVVYGASNCGKTFFMSDLSFHVAQGKEWRGKRVEKGNVMYLSLEGQRGIDNRINAYKLENKVDIDGFLRVPCPINFVSENADDIPLFVEFVNEANKKFGSDIKLIVIDTLARALGGGDENSGVDMGLLVKHSDLIRKNTNAHICFIHHSGKDESKKARGHSSLRAAVDTEIEISRKENDDFSNIKIQKQRDMDMEADMQFKLKRVVLGQNKYNEEVTSCVVEPYILSEDVEARINKKAQKPAIKKAYDATVECVGVRGVIRGSDNLPNVKTITYEQFKEGLDKRGIIELGTSGARSISSRIRKELIEADLIVCRDDFIWLK